jgi:hypothetical protein
MVIAKSKDPEEFVDFELAGERIRSLLEYDSILVNSRQFESLWPRV